VLWEETRRRSRVLRWRSGGGGGGGGEAAEEGERGLLLLLLLVEALGGVGGRGLVEVLGARGGVGAVRVDADGPAGLLLLRGVLEDERVARARVDGVLLPLPELGHVGARVAGGRRRRVRRHAPGRRVAGALHVRQPLPLLPLRLPPLLLLPRLRHRRHVLPRRQRQALPRRAKPLGFRHRRRPRR
jgi:hypothetical protein